MKRLAVALVICAAAGPAWADAANSPKLPSFAADPEALSAPAASPWTGFYVGSEVFAFSRKGAKGGFGGGSYAGYSREFSNGIVIGVQGGMGYSPSWFGHGPYSGFEYASTSVKLGYDMGRLMPYVMGSAVFAKPNLRGPAYVGAFDSANNLLNSPGDIRTYGMVGAGFDYKITEHLRVGVAVSVGNGRMVAP